MSTALIAALAWLVPHAAHAQSADAAVAEPAADAGKPSDAGAGPTDAIASAEAEPSGPADEIVIVGTPVAKTAGSAHVLRERQLERFEQDDPHALLAAVPGVYARGEDGVGLRPNVGVRGVNPDRSKKVTLMEDGVLFGPAPYSAPAAYYFPIMTRMTQLRVIKGPASVAYGPQTVGGAIDLITRPIPAAAAGGLDLAGGAHGYRKAHGHFGSSAGPAGFLIEGVHLGSDGFKTLPDGGDTGFYRNEWMFKGRYALDASGSHELGLKLGYSDELSNETYLGLTDADFDRDPLQRYGASKLDRMRNHRTSVVASHVIDASDDITITTDVYRHDFHRVWRKVNRFRGADLFEVLADPDSPVNAIFHALLAGDGESTTPQESLLIGPNEREFTSQGVQSRLRWDADTGPIAHAIEYGLRLHHDRVDRRHSEDGFVITDGDLIPDGSATTVTAFNEAWTYALAAHAVDAVTWQSLTITPGVRVEALQSGASDRLTGLDSTRRTYAVLPGAGAFYALTGDLGLLAGVYRGFSPPAPGSDEDVEPELSVNYEAGARVKRGPARAELIGFYNDYTNLTDVCTLSSGCSDADVDRQFDAGEARIYGLEAFIDYEAPLGAFTLPVAVAYTLTRAEFRRDFASEDPIFGEVERGDEMPYVPRHQLSAMLGLEHMRAGGAISVGYVSAMREQAGSDPLASALATDAQLTLDLAVRYRVLDRWELYATCRNLLDAHPIVSHRPFGARPSAPRFIQVGTKLTL